MDNQEQRDHAEEAANRALLREGDGGPFAPIGPIEIPCGRHVDEIRHAAHSWDSAGSIVTLGRYHCPGYGAAQLDDAAPAGDPVGQVATATTGPLALDWTLAESSEEHSAGFAALSEYNMGASWAVVCMALDRTTRRGFVDRGAFEAECLLLIRQFGEYGISNG